MEIKPPAELTALVPLMPRVNSRGENWTGHVMMSAVGFQWHVNTTDMIIQQPELTENDV